MQLWPIVMAFVVMVHVVMAEVVVADAVMAHIVMALLYRSCSRTSRDQENVVHSRRLKKEAHA